MSNVFLISDAAKKVEVEAHVLRYWEEELGLPIKRNELGHRYYTEDDVKRFQNIKELKERGLQLKAIRMVLKNGKLNMLPEIGGNVIRERDIAESVAEAEEAFACGTDRGGSQNNAAQSEWNCRQGNLQEIQQPSLLPQSQTEELVPETREEKAARLQWLLQQLFRETLQENNEYLCREMKESILKELDYQFRMQEEREEERSAEKAKRDEEHFKKIDELLRKKRRLLQ